VFDTFFRNKEEDVPALDIYYALEVIASAMDRFDVRRYLTRKYIKVREGGHLQGMKQDYLLYRMAVIAGVKFVSLRIDSKRGMYQAPSRRETGIQLSFLKNNIWALKDMSVNFKRWAMAAQQALLAEKRERISVVELLNNSRPSAGAVMSVAVSGSDAAMAARETRLAVLDDMAKRRDLPPILGYAAIKLYNDETNSHVTVEEAATSAEIQARVLVWAVEHFKLKSIPMMMDLSYEHESIILANISEEKRAQWTKMGRRQEDINGKETIIDLKKLSRPQLHMVLKKKGAEKDDPENADIDWRQLKPFDPKSGRLSVAAETLALLDQKLPKGTPKVALVISPTTLTSYLMGDRMFEGMIDGSDEFKEIFKYSKKYIADYVRYLAKEGKTDMIVFLDPVPTATVSVDMFEEYSVTPINELSELVRSSGLLSAVHPCRPNSDGKADQLFSSMAKYNVDVLSVDSIYKDLAKLHDYIQANFQQGERKPILMGNVDSVRLLTSGTPNEVEQAVKDLFANMGNREFILCSSCDIEYITEGNMGAFSETGRKTAQPFRSQSEQEAEVGGIDIQNIDVARTGTGDAIRFDEAALQELVNKGFDGLTPVFLGITSWSNPLTAMGVK
jgi:uroporphyrinogen-III decarboxylase